MEGLYIFTNKYKFKGSGCQDCLLYLLIINVIICNTVIVYNDQESEAALL